MTLPAYAMSQASFPKLYEEIVVPLLFRPFVDDLLDRVALERGDRVLDVACGTGIVARCAKERLGPDAHVVGVDISAPMLAIAAERGPTIDWREGDAAALPVGGVERFDVVFCQQGLQFFPDKPAALREMKRVLAPGGRVAISCWRSADEVPFFREMQNVAEKHLGKIDDERFGFGDAAALERLLTSVGFQDVKVAKVTRTIRFEDAPMFVKMNSQALVGESKVGAQMTDEGRNQILSVIEREALAAVAPMMRDNVIVADVATNVGTAHV